MSNIIKLRKGLDLPLEGAAEKKVLMEVNPDVVALKPTDFKGLVPKLLVKEGDSVKAGTALFADKMCPEIQFTSPVSGTVQSVIRGEKRKLLAVTVKAAVIAPGVAAAAEEQNDDDNEPQAGTVVVSIVEPHDCHLTLLRHSMRREPVWSLANRKIP